MNEKEIKALVSLLDDTDEQIIIHVEEKISSLGSEIIPFLEEEWENNFNPEVQRRIEELIHMLQYEDLVQKLTFWLESGAVDLLEGMWLIATYQYPDLEYESLKANIEQIYYETWLEFKTGLHPYDQIKRINSILYGKLKFTSNTRNFHAPGNSMLNVAIESRKGNPVTLSVIYMLVAQKLKLPVYGVNLPNLFILTYKSNNIQFYINPFNRGLIFSKTDIDNYLMHLNLKPKDMFYQPCNNVEILKRVLRNLVISFEKLGDSVKENEVKKLLKLFEDEGAL